ncbi:hypothetical protein TNIN_392941 [Trichonephila inaurata madagascariensis]|uniref:Secreted protein n=1 Tax=Trichonephila inaurata madagascariensis TaxID=2747483 RepID=A0A8X6X225_9ARAC|nr:hypothetical protein TNIN_392941 [Trichonephila inaurata madagascariensis]
MGPRLKRSLLILPCQLLGSRLIQTSCRPFLNPYQSNRRIRSHFPVLSVIKAGLNSQSPHFLFTRHGGRKSLCTQSCHLPRDRPW